MQCNLTAQNYKKNLYTGVLTRALCRSLEVVENFIEKFFLEAINYLCISSPEPLGSQGELMVNP